MGHQTDLRSYFLEAGCFFGRIFGAFGVIQTQNR